MPRPKRGACGFVGFSDFQFELLRMVGESEFIVSQLRMTGTHKGEFQFRGTQSMEKPLLPTNNSFDVSGCAIHEVVSNKLKRLWAYWDTTAFLRQLGITPGA